MTVIESASTSVGSAVPQSAFWHIREFTYRVFGKKKNADCGTCLCLAASHQLCEKSLGTTAAGRTARRSLMVTSTRAGACTHTQTTGARRWGVEWLLFV